MSANPKTEAERLQAVILDSMDEPGEDPAAPRGGTEAWARRSLHSRTQFFRLFQALIEETPAAMRRRLLLERAAWHLANTQRAITEIALDAQYGSLEAFTRAFRKAYGTSPSLFRRSGTCLTYLPAPNEFHFCRPQPQRKGATPNMDLFDLFAGTESWYTRRLLEHAAKATDEQLDRPMTFMGRAFGWSQPDQSLREVLERLVLTTELWTAALTKSDMPQFENLPPEDRTPAAMLQRFEKADAAFQRVMGEIRDRGAWDDTFVDALCEPPATFTFGGTFAHIITFNAHRRLMALDALQKLGMPMKGIGCPMEYEAAVATPAAT